MNPQNVIKLTKQLTKIAEQLHELDYLLDSEIIAEDARHLSEDLSSARREMLRLKPEEINELYQVKFLYDELRKIEFGVRVLQNNVDRCRAAIDESKEAMEYISEILTPPEDEEL